MLTTLIAVYWMLKTENSIRGGRILSDEDALGGRRGTVAAFLAVHAYLAYVQNQVETDRQDPTRSMNHLPASKDEALQAEDAKCPLEMACKDQGKPPPFAICCPCVEGGASGLIAIRSQPSLLIVPEELNEGWGRELERLKIY